MWYALVNDAGGALLGASSLPITPAAGQVVVIFETERPDQGTSWVDPRTGQTRFTGATWDPVARTYVPLTPPSFIDRAVALRQRIRTELAADPDFMAAWNALSAARKTQLAAGLDRVITDNITRALRVADRWMLGAEPVDTE